MSASSANTTEFVASPAAAAPEIPGAAGQEPAGTSGPAPEPPLPSAVYPSDFLQDIGGDRPAQGLRSLLVKHGFDVAWGRGYTGSGGTVAVIDEGVDVGHPDLEGTWRVVTDPASPYVGWPEVYDPLSLSTYLTTGTTDGTWYANTSRRGSGPFEVTHTVQVDGTNDFGEAERWGTDPRDNSAASAGGDKQDFDLTDLYVTRDADRWFFGLPVYLRESNATFAILIDVDNVTGGSAVVPAGLLADTNTSHSGPVNGVAISPNGQLVASGSGDRRMRLWDRNGALLRTEERHSSEILSVAWSPDGSKIATADMTALTMWDGATGAFLWQVVYAPDNPIREHGVLAFSPDSSTIAASTFRYVHFLSAATGSPLGTLWAANVPVNAVRYSPSGNQVAVALGDNSVAVYDLNVTNVQPYPPATRAFAAFTLTGHTQPVLDVAWSPDGTKLASGARDNALILWDVPTRTPLATSTAHQSRVTSIAWRPDGTGFASVSQGLLPAIPGRLITWDANGGTLGSRDIGPATYSVAVSSLGEIATASSDLAARLFTWTRAPLRTFVAQRPDFAIVAPGWSRFSERDQGFVHGLDLATVYRWDSGLSAWVGAPILDPSVNGSQASFQFGEMLFNEFSIPRAFLGDPDGLALEAFSAGETPTRPQDTVPSDRNIDFRDVDLTPVRMSLGAFVYRASERYTVDPAVVSQSGEFHFGYHPSPVLQRTFGAVGLLVVDAGAPGVYDTVIVDLNGDRRFDATDPAASVADPLVTLDDRNPGGPGADGYADLSAGLVYFIADGVEPLPYADRYRSRHDTVEDRIPGAGDLVAFFGEFGFDPITSEKSSHGTRIASAIVGQGRLDPDVRGAAYGAELLLVANALSDPVEAWYFAVEGYDGLPGTGDEAHVVVNAFTVPGLPHGGFDTLSRTADFLSSTYSGGRTLFVASAGDAGFGYGSVSAPAAGASVLAVGRATDGTFATVASGRDEGPNPRYGDVAVTSSRGPAPLGTVKPELIAIGTGVTAIPLHSAPDGNQALSPGPWTGSDLSAAVAAAAALVVREAAGTPTADELRSLLGSSADGTGHDVLTQGSGFVNVTRATDLATASGGLVVSPSTATFGGYGPARYDAFPSVLRPGDASTLSVSVENRGPAATTVTVRDRWLRPIGSYTLENRTVRDLVSLDGSITFWLNASGLFKVDGNTFLIQQVSPPVPGLWSGAALVQVTASNDLGDLVTFAGTQHETNYSYTLHAYDWTINWTNWFGTGLAPFPAPSFFMNELNTITETRHVSNALQVRAARPAASLHDGLAIDLKPAPGLGVDDIAWRFRIDFYEAVGWPWLSESPATLPLAAGQTGAVDLTLALPSDTPMGTYQGLVEFEDAATSSVATVPVLVHVAGRGADFVFGGDATSTDLLDNHRVLGGFDLALRNGRVTRPYLGDWRYFYVDVPDQGIYANPRGMKLVIDVTWATKPSDIDILVLARGSLDAFSTDYGNRFGPYPLALRGGAEETDRPQFLTATNASREVVTVDLFSGLNVIVLHNVLLAGAEPFERFAGRGGWMKMEPAVTAVTNELAGTTDMTFVSNLDFPTGVRASAVGPAVTEELRDVEIPPDYQSWWNFPNWGEFMMRGSFTKLINLTKALILEVHLMGHADAPDLDLAVFQDLNGNGVLDFEEVQDANAINRGGSQWAWDADADADETVKWISPPDGPYLIKVLGFTIAGAVGHFDMDIAVTLDTGKGYEIPEAPKPAEVLQGTEGGWPAYTPITFSMAWDFPGDTEDGNFGGAILVGLPEAPGILVIPVIVSIDREAPSITLFSVTTLAGQVRKEDNRTTNDPRPALVWTIADDSRGELVPGSVRVVLDDRDVTSLATVDVPFEQNAAGAYGYWLGTVILEGLSLPDGAHEARLAVEDVAGNVVGSWHTFVVDTRGPPIIVDLPALSYTRQDTIALSGRTEPGASVLVRGAWTVAGADGRFSIVLSLLDGENALEIMAADWFDLDSEGTPIPGNTASVRVSVVLDREPPTIPQAVAPGLTSDSVVQVQGRVEDLIASGVPGDPTSLLLWVAGTRTTVRADGSFRAIVAVVEGTNDVPILARDAAGNEATRTLTATRDSMPPGLTVEPLPDETLRANVTITGHAPGASLVTVNGFGTLVDAAGRFTREVSLSPGTNVIRVVAEDAAGNTVGQEVRIEFVAPRPAPTNPALAAGAGAILGVLLGLLLGLAWTGRGPFRRDVEREGEAISETAEVQEEEPSPPATGAEAPGEETADEEVVERAYERGLLPRDEGERAVARAKLEEEAAEQEAAMAKEAVDLEARIERVETAYREGRIDREVYEANLEKIRGRTPVIPEEDPRVVRLREALAEGKISQEVFEENLRRLRRPK